MTIGIGRSARIVFAASIPSRRGIRTSRMARSGSWLAGERDRLLAVARLGDHLVAGALEQVAQVEADDRLVFGDQDAHGT